VLDKAWVIQRQRAAELGLNDGLQLEVVDRAVRTDRRYELLRIDLRLIAAWQVDRARGEVHAERDHAGDDVEQQAYGVEYHDGGVHSTAALNLATTIRVENTAARGQLRQQRGNQNTANQTGWNAHGDLLIRSRNYTRQMPNQ
jgi:hypothetical protein